MFKLTFSFLIAFQCYVFAAGAGSGFPTPGLYRIDMESQQNHYGSQAPVTINSKHDGKTGDSTTQWSSKNESKSLVSKGQHQTTICQKEASAERAAIPESMKCKDVVVTRGTNSVQTTAKCAFADINTTVTKVDDKTWDFVTKMKMTQAKAMDITSKTRWTRIADTCK